MGESLKGKLEVGGETREADLLSFDIEALKGEGLTPETARGRIAMIKEMLDNPTRVYTHEQTTDMLNHIHDLQDFINESMDKAA